MRELTYARSVGEALQEEMERDSRVILMGEDVGSLGGVFAVTRGLKESFGSDRVMDTPIAEAALSGTAVGAAMTGLRPVLEIMFMDFITAAMDGIVNQAAKMRYMSGGRFAVPLVVRTQSGAGTHHGPQHSQSLENWFVHIPGLLVVMPSNGKDAKGLLKTAIRDDNPVVFIENKKLYNTKCEVPEGEYLIPFGQAHIAREGTGATLVATGRMVHLGLEAAEQLAAEGVDVEVIDPRTLVPLDKETIASSVRKTHRVVVAHEATLRGGWGGEVASWIAEELFDYLDAPVCRVGAKEAPIPFTPVLEDIVVPTTIDLVAAVRKLMGS